MNHNKKLKQKLKKNGFITAKKFQMKEVLCSYIRNLNKIISIGLK